MKLKNINIDRSKYHEDLERVKDIYFGIIFKKDLVAEEGFEPPTSRI